MAKHTGLKQDSNLLNKPQNNALMEFLASAKN